MKVGVIKTYRTLSIWEIREFKVGVMDRNEKLNYKERGLLSKERRSYRQRGILANERYPPGKGRGNETDTEIKN